MKYYSFWKRRVISILTIFIILIQISASCGGKDENKENNKNVKNEKLPNENEEEITKLIDSATDKYIKSDYEGAIKDYNKILKLDSKNATIYGNRGAVKNILEDRKGAIADIKKAIQLEPDNATHYQSLTTVYFDQKKWKNALDYANQAIEKNAEYDLAYYTRGRIKLEMKQKDAACQDFQKALSLGMQDAQYMINENCK